MSPQDEALAGRIRRSLAARRDVVERRMFGGGAFMVRGHMACGTVRDRLMVRLGDAGSAAALKERHVQPMDFTGKVVKSMVFVRQEGIRTSKALKEWLDRALAFNATLEKRRE